MNGRVGLFGRRDLLLLILLIFLVIVGLSGLVMATGWREVWASLGAVSVMQIGALLGLTICNFTLRSLRWHMFARSLAIPVSLWINIRLYFAGLLMIATPARVGELVRLRWLGRESGQPLEVTSPMVVLDRASDLLAIGALLLLCLAAGSGISGALPAAAFTLVVAFMVTRPLLFEALLKLVWRAVGRWPRLFVKARRAAKSLAVFSRPSVLVATLGLGGLGWFAEGVSFWLLLNWMGADIDLWAAVAIFALSMLTGGATGMPGGLGGAEMALVTLLSMQGVALEIAAPATALIRLTTLWFAIAIGFVISPVVEKASRKALDAVEK